VTHAIVQSRSSIYDTVRIEVQPFNVMKEMYSDSCINVVTPG
jgi:hypothetical protein